MPAAPSCPPTGPSPDEEPAMTRTKTVIKWLVIGFLVYAVVKSPQQAADIMRTAFDIVAQGFTAIFSFFDALLSS
jgi:hypothetical protein